MMRVSHCTRAFFVLLATAALLGSASSRATAQTPRVCLHRLHPGEAVGTECISVARLADRFTITSTRASARLIDSVIREFKAR